MPRMRIPDDRKGPNRRVRVNTANMISLACALLLIGELLYVILGDMAQR